MTKQGWYIIGALAIIAGLLLGAKVVFGQDQKPACLPLSYANTFLETNGLKRYVWLKVDEKVKFVLTLKGSTQEWLLLSEDDKVSCLLFDGKGFAINGAIDQLMDMRDAQND